MRDRYRQGLEQMVGHLGVLDGRGAPQISGEAPAVRGCGSSGSRRGLR
ncbi:hypothetical protein [Mycobacterium sp. JS623]|nr:hypothetical protein [Mycobacterium sp. JS623]